jgi:hypothetical protein
MACPERSEGTLAILDSSLRSERFAALLRRGVCPEHRRRAPQNDTRNRLGHKYDAAEGCCVWNVLNDLNHTGKQVARDRPMAYKKHLMQLVLRRRTK